MLDVEKTKITKSNVVFNGLGGHSRLDDTFPTPRKPAPIALKRYKSTTKAASGKIKKLAPLPTSKGLDGFISLLTDDDEN